MKYRNLLDYLPKNDIPETICEECRLNGDSIYGTCARCLRNQAKITEYVETHAFIVDDCIMDYHNGSCNHDLLKATPLREPDERPRLFYGIELEVSFEDAGISFSDIAREFAEITNGIAVFERDGSVDDGFEIIFRPMSKRRAYREFGKGGAVRKGLEYLEQQGADICQPSGNGIHIHISKNFFRAGSESINHYGSEMNWLFQVFQPQLEQLCGRKYYHYCQGAKKIAEDRLTGGVFGDIVFEGARLKKGNDIPYDDHGVAFNERSATYEARIFHSTINPDTILSYIEIMSNFAHTVRDGDPHDKTLDEILHQEDNLYLDKHIKKCRNREFKNGNKATIELKATNKDEIKLGV